MSKMGRPKSENPSCRIVTIRFTDQEYERLKRLAAYHRLTVTDTIKKGVKSLQNDECFRESSVLDDGGFKNGTEERQ